jgi:molybdate transport system ATP-binding protein
MTAPDDSATPSVAIDAIVASGSFVVSASFRAAEGITALFGPSGSGKSVTLAAIAGLLRPTSGTIQIAGAIVADVQQRVHVATQARRVGMVFQSAVLLPHRSPLDNVALAVRRGDRRQRRAVAQQWLERVNATHLATAPTSTLSGGEQQRVALARALAGQPSVLLLDEPFSALDQPTRISVRAMVRTLVDEQRIAALIVTHDLDDITQLADAVVLFEPGRTIGTHQVDRTNSASIAEVLGLAR